MERQIKSFLKAYKDLVVDTRRDLHRIPEVAYTEEKTSAYVTDYLSREHAGFMAVSGIRYRIRCGRPLPVSRRGGGRGV